LQSKEHTLRDLLIGRATTAREANAFDDFGNDSHVLEVLENRTLGASMSSCPLCPRGGKSESIHPDIPDVVIPFWEHDLCKMKYTVKSIGINDPHGHLGQVFLMWISKSPSAAFQGEIDEIVRGASANRKVTFIDFSPQVLAEPIMSGWYAQQVLKLKMASRITSEFYLVMDSKNTLIRPLRANEFINQCNAGKIFGRYRHDQIPSPHREWYAASARALGVKVPTSGYWPPSITPMVMHKASVLRMLSSIGEDPNTTKVCAGPLCKMLGACTKSGKGATEFTMYLLFAHSEQTFNCIHAAEVPSNISNLAHRWSVSLWRGQVNREKNIRRAEVIASGLQIPIMFGAQASALDGMTSTQQSEVQNHVAHVFKSTGLETQRPADALCECVIGPPTTASTIPGQTTLPFWLQPTTTTTTLDWRHRFTGDFCCFGASVSDHICDSCTGVRKSGFCSKSKDNCTKCGGHFCDFDRPPVHEDHWSCQLDMTGGSSESSNSTDGSSESSNSTETTQVVSTTTTATTTATVTTVATATTGSSTRTSLRNTTSQATNTSTTVGWTAEMPGPSVTSHSEDSSISSSSEVPTEIKPTTSSESGPEHEDEVFWEPLDMPTPIDMPNRSSRVSPVQAEDITECQKICAQTTGCRHYSFWKEAKVCHLQDSWASRAEKRHGWVSGPFKNWDELDHGKFVKLSPKAYVDKDLECLTLATLWSPIFGVPAYFNQIRDTKVAFKKCESLCKSVQGCAHWSMMLPGNLCRLAGDNAWKLSDFAVISGDVDCANAAGGQHANDQPHFAPWIQEVVRQEEEKVHVIVDKEKAAAAGPLAAAASTFFGVLLAFLTSAALVAAAARRALRQVAPAATVEEACGMVQFERSSRPPAGSLSAQEE
jgi:hypothetical protein